MTMAKRKIYNNLGLKALSVVLAISLWCYVNYKGQTETIIDAPIEFTNLPKGMEVSKQSIKKVSLSLRGHESILRGLRPMDIRMVIDLSTTKQGETTLYFNKNDVLLPRAIKVLRMEPTYTKITIDEVVSKVVPIKVELIGTPEKGYKVESVEITPSSVTVEGAKAEVARVAILRTEPLELTGLDSSIAQDVKINANGKNVKTNISEVMVKISIKRTGK